MLCAFILPDLSPFVLPGSSPFVLQDLSPFVLLDLSSAFWIHVFFFVFSTCLPLLYYDVLCSLKIDS